jgi:hypothetical protein
MICKTKEAKLKQADSFISLGDKFYWSPQIALLLYLFKIDNISHFDLFLFLIFVIISSIFIFIGVKMSNKGFQIYDEVYNSNGYNKLQEKTSNP